MYTLCLVLILIASVLLVLAVLVQNPKSGMAANFGASNQVMGVRQTADFLEKLTWGLSVAILVLSLLATLAMDGHLVSQSNAAAQEANALIEKINTPAEEAARSVLPSNRPATPLFSPACWEPGFQALGTEHLPGALCSGTGSPALGLCSP